MPLAYTISGEWEYEGLTVTEGAIACAPMGSAHTPRSDKGAEVVLFLRSETNDFLINHMPDGSDHPIDILQGVRGQHARAGDEAR